MGLCCALEARCRFADGCRAAAGPTREWAGPRTLVARPGRRDGEGGTTRRETLNRQEPGDEEVDRR